MKKDIYISIICVIGYVIGSLLVMSNNVRTIGQQDAELIMSRELIKKQEAYITELEIRLADKYNRAVTLTAYTARSRECDETPHVTAMMVKPRPGRTIAVSRDLFDDGWTFGRSVYIEGHGVFVIEDLMHRRHTQRIDILMGTVNEANKFGKVTGQAVLIEKTVYGLRSAVYRDANG
jgi:3D (Asp-Asp-Asp) domain-containing protein